MLPTEMKSTPVSAIFADRVETHSARGLELEGPRRAAIDLHPRGHVGQGEIVEHGDIRAGPDRLIELLETLHFDLDGHSRAGRPGRRDRLRRSSPPP